MGTPDHRRAVMLLLAVVTVANTAVSAVAVSPAAAAGPPVGVDGDHIESDWAAAVAGLLRRCEAGGHGELAAFIRDWQLPEEGERQFVLAIPAVAPQSTTPDWVDTPTEQAIWTDFLAARRDRAAGTFALALTAGQAADRELPGLEDHTAAAIRLLYRSLRDDPDHARAREAGGWVKRDDQWVWPEAARRLDKGEEYSPEFGWLPRGRQQRYQAGERYERGRWTKVGAVDRERAPPSRAPLNRRPDIEQQGWKFASDHWQITTTADTVAAATLARQLEEAHTAWLQVFGQFQRESAEWEQLLEGRGRPRPLEPFAAKLTANRQDYIAALEPLEPAIVRTLGIYWMPTHTAWFFVGEGQEPTTVHHEATHQLFAEKRRTSPLAGERCGFWAIEAAACYMESLEPTAWGWTVGGRTTGRAATARERLVEDGFHVPLAELTALGRRAFQADDRLPQIYSEISGLADFFMNGQRARYRAAFIEYLVRIHTGTVDADTLSRLCRRSYGELDDEYRRHMAR
jgi:hypothetical protein